MTNHTRRRRRGGQDDGGHDGEEVMMMMMMMGVSGVWVAVVGGVWWLVTKAETTEM
jgi:hypothetical protein